MWARMLSTISLARSASLTMQPSASMTSARFGGLISRKRMPARALLRAVAIGCRTSWASEAVNSPMTLRRFTCAKSASSCLRRARSACACLRSVTSMVVPTASEALHRRSKRDG